ncbi:threonine--tRNA ligase [Candidatus Woesebacteria bacterium RIFCSPLOWO2_01_FULL_39_23]|uniref:Threonine--tRNA ligase n=1 Tax=Candidatus Woesebacteria bacterium RIFCSPHIGHO2_01_FULL_40_22 TaxID=1802499 RepID=A0A1F7YJM1_9BACT|nr:MAG: threonine--tRNA ligase [Candidatus Woesebacteria bacterium RBG_16_40_11]OGM27390.1 MAG: threonine--tRNA ligase [Candidatus Woesebacteria bacterium RIFCSPHIGHO2_01_FULL_40_22]OGM62562.1 MAG: threonine--tRNA ligase [Candidatus Woesebacteria bacterium RIFCSPLOWO2_01_FULL_39_23]
MSKVLDKKLEKMDPKERELWALRHTAEHVLHTALQNLYPNLKKAMGPATPDGFYNDFDLNEKITEADFPKIEKEMQRLIDADFPMVQEYITPEKARSIFKNNRYKMEWVEDIKKRGEKISVYKMGEEEIDLCSGPHVTSTGKIKAFKLLSVAGAYWHGDEKNKMLTRVYGTAFTTQDEMNKYLTQLEEAKKRDHRKIGKDMQLFTFADEVGPGLPLWMPKGTVIQTELRNWAEETEKKWGYVRVRTPHIAKHTLYEISGHLPYYKDDMYSPMDIDGEEYYLKGMNCPHHHMIFKATPKSYRDLPLRYAEYGEVYRYEQSGTLFGLMRVRFIQQNDAHIYCTEDQAEKEFLDVLKLHEYYYNTLGLTKKDYHIVIGLPDEKKRDKYHGDKALWDKAEKMMRNAIDKSAIKHIDDVGGAAFYGPKVDFNITSSVGREFGISTNQLDLYMPTRFNLEYTDAKGNKQLAVVIHRAPLGSHERFIGFLIEHYGGNFPTWLSPVQVKVLPISTRHMDYANKISNTLRENDIRAELDDRNATLPGKIRDAQNEKVNYMLIVGDREMKTNTVMQRARSGESDGPFSLDIFIKNIKNEIGDKAIWKSDQKSF